MINYVPYQKIDKIKYDDCISRSKESRIYAFSWYLDCVTDHWDIIVEGDYESVMPLPRKKKFGIAYVYTPPWIQQLGIYSLKEVTEQTQEEFLKILSRKFQWIDYHFSSVQNETRRSFTIKKNYLLYLQDGILTIQEKYNKNRKRISRKPFMDFTLDKNGSIDFFIEKFKNLDKPYQIKEESIDLLKSLYFKNQDQVFVWNVFYEKEYVGGLVWLKDDHRITYLAPLVTQIGKQRHVPTFLINELIKDFEGQNLILDFEGSMLPGVEKFYRSFGAQPEFYYYFKKRFIHHA